jgi:hypothetical protein
MNSRYYAIKNVAATLQPNGSYLTNDNITVWFNDLGQYHRLDGPAITYNNTSRVCWYISGNNYTINTYLKHTPISDEQKLLLRLQYD